MDKHLQTGQIGEELACRYLEEQGYRLLERNWRHEHKEIDLIAQWGATLCIIEVKTRSAGSYQKARESVTRDKQAFLIQAADAYVREQRLSLEVRYDIIALQIAADGSYSLEHIEQAFVPTLRTLRSSAKHPRGRRIVTAAKS